MSVTGPVIPKELEELRYPAIDSYRSIFAASFLAIGIYLIAVFLFSPDPVLPHHDAKGGEHHGEKAEVHPDQHSQGDTHHPEKAEGEPHKPKTDKEPHEQPEKSH